MKAIYGESDFSVKCVNGFCQLDRSVTGKLLVASAVLPAQRYLLRFFMATPSNETNIWW